MMRLLDDDLVMGAVESIPEPGPHSAVGRCWVIQFLFNLGQHFPQLGPAFLMQPSAPGRPADRPSRLPIRKSIARFSPAACAIHGGIRESWSWVIVIGQPLLSPRHDI